MTNKNTRYGVDVAHSRADDLDKLMLQAVTEVVSCRVLDIGCGAGGQSQRLVQAGAQVVAVDIDDYSAQFAVLRSELGVIDTVLQFHQADIRTWLQGCAGEQFTVCCLQRTIHYVPYADALAVLRRLKEVVNGSLYISVTGLETAIAEYYSAAQLPVSQRFVALSSIGVELFHITEPVCLYTQEEFVSLLEQAGWTVERSWVSAFGNIKAVCK